MLVWFLPGRRLLVPPAGQQDNCFPNINPAVSTTNYNTNNGNLDWYFLYATCMLVQCDVVFGFHFSWKKPIFCFIELLSCKLVVIFTVYTVLCSYFWLSPHTASFPSFSGYVIFVVFQLDEKIPVWSSAEERY